MRTLLQTKLINILNIHTNPDFKFLAECTEWVSQKLVSSPQPLLTNPYYSVKQTYEHWTAIRATQRANLLTPLNEATNTTVVRIESDGQGTVITMGGVGSETNASFRFLLESLDWVAKTLVSS